MGKGSGIQYVHHSIGWWRGCHKIRIGCQLCFGEREMNRYGHKPDQVVRALPKTFNAPFEWNEEAKAAGERRRVFVTPWSDLWIEEADGWRDEVLNMVRLCDRLDFIAPTKRLDRALAWLNGRRLPPNLIPLASVSVQRDVDEVVPYLNRLHVTLKGLSYEPAIGPIDLLTPEAPAGMAVDWVVAGCESASPQAPGRPADLDWFRAVRDTCQAVGIPFYLKQIAVDGKLVHSPHLDGVQHLAYPEPLAYGG